MLNINPKLKEVIAGVKVSLDEIKDVEKKVKALNEKAVTIGQGVTSRITEYIKKENLLGRHQWVYSTNEQFMYLLSTQPVDQGDQIFEIMASVNIEEIPIAEGMSISVSEDKRLLVVLTNATTAVLHIKELGMRVDFTKLEESYKHFKSMHDAMVSTQKSDIVIATSIPDNVVPIGNPKLN